MIYTGIKLPAGIEFPLGEADKDGIPSTKVYKEDELNIREMISKELCEHKELIEDGNGDSSDGSDEEPSEGMCL